MGDPAWEWVAIGASVLVVAGASIALLWLGAGARRSTTGVWAMHIRYQPRSLLVAIGALVMTWGVRAMTGRPLEPLRWLTVGSFDTPAIGLCLFGEPGDDWWWVGVRFAIIATLLTTLVVWLQSTPRPRRSALLPVLPAAVGVSRVNALVEELIFRVSVIQGLHDIVSPWKVAVVSGLLFGLPHWFGRPGRLPGVLMAGSLGWLMCLATLQTGGLLWAWAIHALQDIAILTILFGSERTSSTGHRNAA